VSQGGLSQESFIAVTPSAAPGAQNVRQLLLFEFQPATNTYVQVEAEVIIAADPMTGLPVQLATSDQMTEVIQLLRGMLKANVELLNVLSEQTSYDEDDFI
jgi:hypothetical protein